MGNSASHDSLLATKTSLCKERRSHLKNALEGRAKLASAQLKFHSCHQEFANAIRTFIEEQNLSSSAASQDRNEQVEDDDNEDEITENVNEGALITRRQGNINVVERMGGLRFLKQLEGVEKQFRNAYVSGKDVSEKLEANNLVNKSSASQPMKLVRSLSRSNSRVSCSTFLRVELMGTTLGEIASWEVKLHKELENFKSAETKKTKLRRQNQEDSSNENNLKTNVNCTTAEQAANNNSKEIAKLRNERFLPRLGEQLEGLRRNWKAMSEFYQSQKRILSQVEESPNHPLLCEDSHQQATKQIKKQLCNLLNSFESYVSTQKKYMESLCWWLYKNEIPIIVGEIDGNQWDSLERLGSYKEVVVAQIMFKEDVASLLKKQSKEHEKKREIERLEHRVIIKRDMINEVNEKQTLEEIEKLEDRIKKTKEEHQSKMQETQQKLNDFQIGFSNFFEKLADFSGEAAKIYDELINHLPCRSLQSQLL